MYCTYRMFLILCVLMVIILPSFAVDGGYYNLRGNGNHGRCRAGASDFGDIGIRFSKCHSLDGDDLPPLNRLDYPIGGDLAKHLKESSNAVSVITNQDPELDGIEVCDYIQRVGGCPSYPNYDPNHPFWDEFGEVVSAQKHRLANGKVSDVMVLPDLWEGYTVHDVAEAVHDEYPGYHQAELLKSLFARGVEIDYDVLPFRSMVDFVGGPVRMADLNTHAIAIVAPVNFRAKWHCGRARPEEVAKLIQTGGIPQESVPADIYNDVMEMEMSKNASQFTAYSEGCPRHPAWPAMHSAASSASFWMSVVFNLTPEQYCQALLTDYAVSYGRTVAGVHYMSDNIDGLNLGQMVLADTLADHLVERYGSSRKNVQAKIDSMRFDWNDFDPFKCQS